MPVAATSACCDRNGPSQVADCFPTRKADLTVPAHTQAVFAQWHCKRLGWAKLKETPCAPAATPTVAAGGTAVAGGG